MIKLFNDDCLNVLPKLSDNSINAIIADLPYYVTNYEFDKQWVTEDEYLLWVEDVMGYFRRILTDDGSIMLFSSRQYNRVINQLLFDYGFKEQRVIIWARKRFNTTRGKALASGYEPISYYTVSKDNYTFNNIKIKPNTNRKEYISGTLKDGVNLSDVWSDIPALPHNSKERVNHPTQKPIALMERCVSLITNENDTVLDFCMGSGTTGVACKNLNRNFIGIEINKEYFDIAKKRIENA